MPAPHAPQPTSDNPLAGLRFATASAMPYGTMSLDGGEIDRALGGGLALGCLHEITSPGIEAELGVSTAAFVLPLLTRLTSEKPIFWVARDCDLYPPGLLGFGFNPDRLIQLHAKSDDEALACTELLLRGGVAAAVVCEAGHAGKLAGRRLQLACLRHATTGFLLRRFPFGVGARAPQPLSFAVTRWRISPAPSETVLEEPGASRLRAALLHARSGIPGEWIIEPQETKDASHPFRLAAALADPAQNLRRDLAG